MRNRNLYEKTLHKVMDEVQDDLEDIIEDDRQRLADLISARNIALALGVSFALEGLIDWEEYKLDLLHRFTDVLAMGVADTGGFTMSQVSDKAFSLFSDGVVTYFQTELARSVTEIVRETQQAISDILSWGYSQGLSSKKIAGAMRPLIGLDAVRARQLQRYTERLVKSGEKQAVIDRMVEQYREELLRARAFTIAVTESSRAVNFANREAMKQAGVQKHMWLTAQDERVCEECGPLDGEEAYLGSAFEGDGLGPPVHPRCRCCTIPVTE